jgi:hypothetical protein
MQYLCEAYTAGGPVAIIQLAHLALWDGAEDYFAAINEAREGCLQVTSSSKHASPVCLFYQESDGNFHIYYDRATVVVLSEIYAEEGFQIRLHSPGIVPAIKEAPRVKLCAFGGKIVIFDAAIPGAAIELREVGCERVVLGDEPQSFQYDAALIDVDSGEWEVLELYHENANLSFSGLLFRLIS